MMSNGLTPESDQPMETMPEIVDKFLDMELQKTSVRKVELENERQRDQYAHEYSIQALETYSKQDRMFSEHVAKDRRETRIVIVIVSVCIVLLLAALIFKDKDELLIELLKLGAVAVGSGAGGYGLGRHKSKQEPPSQAE